MVSRRISQNTPAPRISRNHHCPVCNGIRTEIIMDVERAPHSCAQLFLSRKAAAESVRCDLNIYWCSECGHLWNAAYEPGNHTDYSTDYYSSVTGSSQARDYQRAIANWLHKCVELDGKTVLEVGCGDGFFLELIGNLGADAVGFEPSSTFDIAAKRQGVRIHNSYFPFNQVNPVVDNVDVVVLRHVLEHLESPNEALRALSAGCLGSPGPQFMLIEVPNGSEILSNNLYFDFYNDHIHYFSIDSLSQILKSAGWLVIDRLENSNEFMVLVCERATRPATSGGNESSGSIEIPILSAGAASDFRKGFAKWKRDLQSVVLSISDDVGRFAVWGAGARGVSLLANLGFDTGSIAFAIDFDPNKQGKYLPVTGIPIYSPEILATEKVDAVLVTSFTYFDEILEDLSAYRESGGRVIRAYPTPLVIHGV